MTPATRPVAVVTGLGAMSPLGADVPTLWDALLAGKSGVRELTEPWAGDLPVRIGAPSPVDPATLLDRVKARTMDRCQQFAMVAAREAWTDAGEPDVEPERLAVVIGTGIGGVTSLLAQDELRRERGPRRVSPYAVPMLMPNAAAASVGLMLHAKAGVHTPVSACASGAEAIWLGLGLLRSGQADVVVCGGTEAALHPLPMSAFATMRALSPRNDEPQAASRPFDKARNGFVLGEGAGAVVLETAEHAARRGRQGHALLVGAGASSDAHHVAAPDPEGAGAARAMELALADAAVSPEEVSHVNAHATSTPAGDVAEAMAIRSVLGDAADHAAVTATKSLMGHLLGAAGAVEAIATVLALRERVAPPIANLDDPDDAVRLDLIRVTPRELAHGAAVSNSFGFGGHNVSLVFRAVS
jgi:3-oxoacyl-[acyl-carrier-protein] synthase II